MLPQAILLGDLFFNSNTFNLRVLQKYYIISIINTALHNIQMTDCNCQSKQTSNTYYQEKNMQISIVCVQTNAPQYKQRQQLHDAHLSFCLLMYLCECVFWVPACLWRPIVKSFRIEEVQKRGNLSSCNCEYQTENLRCHTPRTRLRSAAPPCPLQRTQ